MLALLKSRKFLAAMVGVIIVVVVQLTGMDEAKAQAIGQTVLGVIIAYIGGSALEDAAEKRAGGDPDPAAKP
jgi:hypothetical protein